MCDLNKPKLLKLINNTVINNRNILNKLLENILMQIYNLRY